MLRNLAMSVAILAAFGHIWPFLAILAAFVIGRDGPKNAVDTSKLSQTCKRNKSFKTSVMGLLFRIILMAVAAFLTARLLPGVTIDNAVTAILVALVLALLNAFLRPILVALTLPVTIITLGLFLLVIDMLIILLAARIVPGFTVDGWLTALLFALIMALISYLLDLVL
jgi:putative membrane protein